MKMERRVKKMYSKKLWTWKFKRRSIRVNYRMEMSSNFNLKMTPRSPVLTALILYYFQVGGEGQPVHFAPILAGRPTARYTGYVYGFKWRMSKLNTWRWGEKNKENQCPYSYTHKSYMLNKVWDFTVFASWRIKKGETLRILCASEISSDVTAVTLCLDPLTISISTKKISSGSV